MRESWICYVISLAGNGVPLGCRVLCGGSKIAGTRFTSPGTFRESNPNGSSPNAKTRTKICQLCPRSKLLTICPAGHGGHRKRPEGRKDSTQATPAVFSMRRKPKRDNDVGYLLAPLRESIFRFIHSLHVTSALAHALASAQSSSRPTRCSKPFSFPVLDSVSAQAKLKFFDIKILPASDCSP